MPLDPALLEGFDEGNKLQSKPSIDPELLKGFDLAEGSKPSLDPSLLEGFNDTNSTSDGLWNTVKDTGLSWLDKVVQTLDYAANTNRSGLKNLIEKGDYSSGAEAGAMKKTQTSPRELRDALTEKLGLGKLRFGEEPSLPWYADPGTIPNFAADLVTDVFTDPLSLLSMGVSKVAKGAGTLAKAGITSKAIENYKTFKSVATPAIGGVYGASIPDENATPLDRLKYAIGGAATTAVLGKSLLYLGKQITELGDATTDWYAKWTRPELFEKMNALKNEVGDTPFKDTGYSTLHKMATGAMGKIKTIAENIRQKKYAPLQNLSDEDYLATVNLQKELGNAFVQIRNPLAKVNDEFYQPGSVKWNQRRQMIDEFANEKIETEILPGLLAKQNDNVKNAIAQIKKANQEIIENFNKTRYKLRNETIINKAKKIDPNSDSLTLADRNILKDAATREWSYYDPNRLDKVRDPGFDLPDGYVTRQDKKWLDAVANNQKPITTISTMGDDVAEKIWTREAKRLGLKVKNINGQLAAYKEEKNLNRLLNAKSEKESWEALGYKEKPKLYDPSTGEGIRGFDYHTGSDVVVNKSMAKQFKNADEVMKATNIAMKKKLTNKEAISREFENFKTGLYADQFAKDYLDEVESTAQKLLMEYKTTLPKQASMRTLEAGLKLYDSGLSFIKGNLLHFSTSWVKNNYFGNFLQAYIANGLPNALDVAKQAGNPFNKLGKDMWDLYRGKLQRVHSDEVITDAMKRGVLDSPTYKALMDEDTMKSLFTPDQLKEMLKEKGVVGQAIEKWRDVLDKTTGQLGSYIEGSGRLITYANVLDWLKSSKLAKDVPIEKLKDIAAKVSRETFYDYRLSVTPFEQATFKRLLPFFAYYKNATPFWVRAAFNPETVGRVANIKKVQGNIGEDPTPQEKLGMDPWLLNSSPRKMGRTATGEKKYIIFPSLPVDDAINLLNVKELPDQFLARLSPLLKTPLEMATNYDTFTRGPLRPSTTGRKFLFSRGNKDILIRDAISTVGLDPDETLGRIFAVNGVKLDKRGNPYATDDGQVLLSKLYQTLFPTGLIDQMIGSYSKVSHGKETTMEALMNRLTPAQTVKVTPLREAQVRQNRLSNRDELRLKLRERKKQLERLKEELQNRR